MLLVVSGTVFVKGSVVDEVIGTVDNEVDVVNGEVDEVDEANEADEADEADEVYEGIDVVGVVNGSGD